MRPYFATSASPERIVAFGKGRERRDVGEHGHRLVERADEVLSLGQVHGRLAPDRRVDHGRQRRRHLDEGDSPHVRGGHEAREVPDGAAAEGHDQIVPVRLLRRELALERRHHLDRLGLLPLGDAEMDAGDVATRQAGDERGEVPGGDGLVGNDEGPLGAMELGEQLSRVLEEFPANDDRVVAARDRDPHALQRRSSPSIASATSSTVPRASTTWAANSR